MHKNSQAVEIKHFELGQQNIPNPFNSCIQPNLENIIDSNITDFDDCDIDEEVVGNIDPKAFPFKGNYAVFKPHLNPK